MHRLLPLALLAVTAGAQSPLATAWDRFATALAPKLAKPDANFCFSSASLSLCMAMLLPGARGKTLAELQPWLCPEGQDVEAALAGVPALLAHLRSARQLELAVSHDLWPQAGHPLLPDYLAAVKVGFGAEVRPLDFVASPDRARKTINDHVASRTKDRIVELLPPDAIDTDVRLVLTNAIYFKGDWQHPFAADQTRDGAFRLLDGVEVKVPLMHQTAAFPYDERDGVQIVRLPYGDVDYAFDVALPKPDGDLATAENALHAGLAAFKGLLESKKPQMIAVTLPRFRVDGAYRLREPLRQLGLVETTSAGHADFTGIDGGAGKLYVAEVVQKTFLEVGEKGTEAAAATAVVMKRGGREPASVVRFTADRPFAFALRHLRTGLVLFAGRVVDPRAKGKG